MRQHLTFAMNGYLCLLAVFVMPVVSAQAVLAQERAFGLITLPRSEMTNTFEMATLNEKYLRPICVKLARNWHSPVSASYHLQTGNMDDFAKLALYETTNAHSHAGAEQRATVTFTLDRDGKLGELRLEKGSGDDAFDIAVIDAVKALPPLPPLPEFVRKKVIVKFNFTPAP
jgi:TonB family protein